MDLNRKQQLIYENGGVSLISLMLHISNLSSSEIKKHMDYVFKNLLNLADGLALINRNHICHNDFNYNNVVTGLDESFNIDVVNNQFRLIDFGLAVNYSPEYIETNNMFNDVNGLNNIILKDEFYSCLDKILLMALVYIKKDSSKIVPNNIKTYFNKNLYYIVNKLNKNPQMNYLYKYFDYFYDTIEEEFAKIIDTHIIQGDIDSCYRTIALLVSTADTYTFGYLLYSLSYQPLLTTDEQKEIIKAFLKERKLLDSVPKMRPPSSELGELYRELLGRLYPTA